MPPPALVVVAAALLVRLAYGLAGRRRGLPAVLAGLTCSQLALHITFELGAHAAAGHHHTHVLSPAELLLERDGHGLAGAGPMTAAHLVAVLITGLLLYRAERIVWAAEALRSTLPKAAARLVGPLTVAAARLRRLLAAMATGAGAPAPRPAGCYRLAGPAPAGPRDLPVGRRARRRGPPGAAPRPHLRSAA
jgi:hypothetical protein